MPDVVARLERARHAHVADVGCGQGFSTVAIARAFLDAHVDGLDADAASIADARRHAADAGLDGRLRFLHADATTLAAYGPYDLVLILEALHDMSRPVDALAAARAALAPGGTVLVVDERVADRFTAPGDEVERMMYGWSVTHCLPTQLAEQPSAAMGTVMRAGTVRALAAEAGYSHVDVLAVDNEFFRFYRLDP
jgi:trans-aconitate methyltransferase